MENVLLETGLYSMKQSYIPPSKLQKSKVLRNVLSATFEVCSGKTLMKAKKHVLQNGTTGLKNPVEGNIPSLE